VEKTGAVEQVAQALFSRALRGQSGGSIRSRRPLAAR